MFQAADSPWLVPFDGSFSVADAPTKPPKKAPSKKAAKTGLAALNERLATLQDVLYAHDRHALLVVFQAMDAAGKDGTLRAVMSGVNPAGCQVFSFKQPSKEELDHDFLWRTAKRLPERGRIGLFNRSYYEEVLVVKVHPQILKAQQLPEQPPDLETVFANRYASIRDHELHLARNGVVVVKFWLNVSKDEQKSRLLRRIDDPARNWKFDEGDIRERGHWASYMSAYQEALNETSRPFAPWYAIPADDKSYMRLQVAEVLVATLENMGLKYPTLSDAETARLQGYRRALEEER